MKMKTAVICAYWNHRPLAASQYVAWIQAYISGLQRVCAALSEMYVIEPSAKSASRLTPSLDNAETLLLGALPRDWAYVSAAGKRGPLTLESHSRNGFLNTLATNLDYDSEGAVLEVSVGAKDPKAISSVISRFRGERFADPALLKLLFEYSITACKPVYAYAALETFDAMSNVDEIPLGWLTYVKDLPAALALPEGVFLHRMGVGAILEVQDGERPDMSKYPQRLSDLRRALASAGLLADPLA